MDATSLHLATTDVSDENGTMVREISLVEGDKLMISGHDMGPGVQAVFHAEEYEFFRCFTAPETARLAELLKTVVGVDLLVTLANRFESTHDMETFAKANGVPGELTTWLH